MNFVGLVRVTLTRMYIMKRDSYVGIGKKSRLKIISLDVSMAMNFNDTSSIFLLPSVFFFCFFFTGFKNFGLVGGT